MRQNRLFNNLLKYSPIITYRGNLFETPLILKWIFDELSTSDLVWKGFNGDV